MRQPPRLHRHQSGQYFVKWAGKTRYLGRNRDEAEARYLGDPTDGLPAWTRWHEQKRSLCRVQATARSLLSVADLEERFLDDRELTLGAGGREFYRKHLKRFVLAYGSDRAATLDVIHLQALRDEMLRRGFAAKTTNHDIQAVKTLLNWGGDLHLIPTVNLRGCRKLPEPEVQDRSWTRGEVKDLILGPRLGSGKRTPFPGSANLQAWLAVTYLTGMRPIETVRLIQGQGRWVRRGIFAMKNKSHRHVVLARHVMFTGEAFGWYRQCQPTWSRLDSFSAATRTAVGQGPHRLRHSAATHLLDEHIPRGEVDEWLGHYPRRVSLVYMLPRFQHLRQLGVHVSLRIAASQGSV